MKPKLLLLLPLLASWPHLALADRCAAPILRDYYSVDSSYFVRVVPRFEPERYYKWQQATPKRKLRFSSKDTVIVPCHAMLYQRSGGNFLLIWKQNLVNEIAPDAASVSKDGRYVVTLDNHCWRGYGPNVMAVYNYEGKLLQQYSLAQISPFPIDQYSMSRSSIRWRCDAKFVAPEQIALCFETQDKRKQNRIYSLSKLDFE